MKYFGKIGIENPSEVIFHLLVYSNKLEFYNTK